MNKYYKDLVDVCVGRMSLKQVSDEIRLWMSLKSPKRLIVEIDRKKDGYVATFLMDEKSFNKKGR